MGNRKFSLLTTFSFLLFFSATDAQNLTLPADCANKVQISVNLIPFNATSSAPIRCFLGYNYTDFYVVYQQTEPSLWSFLLSAPSTNAYIGIGFSPLKGRMVGSSAVVGWVRPDGTAVSKQYYLGGRRPREVNPDEGELVLVGGGPTISRFGDRTYIMFQLNVTQPETRVIYSRGPDGFFPGDDFRLVEHQVAASTIVDYQTGVSRQVKISNNVQSSHRILTILGWGILIPIGMIMARYAKRWDPFWFCAHITIQALGFGLGIGGVVTGFFFKKQIVLNIRTHEAIGLLIAILGLLQVLAIVLRPNKSSKERRYWNWYHHNVGRAAIIFAIANIFYGMDLADEKKPWRTGYGIILGIWLLVSFVLETLSCLSRRKSSRYT